MKIAKYVPCDLVNGEGVRAVLFVQGCAHHCKGCYNQSSWNPDAPNAMEFTDELEYQIIKDLKSTERPLDGLTLSGGDPLLPSNAEALFPFLQRVRFECPDKTIWLWTGYTRAEFKSNKTQMRVAAMCDVIIEGRYDETRKVKDPNSCWYGSENQKLLRVNRELIKRMSQKRR